MRVNKGYPINLIKREQTEVKKSARHSPVHIINEEFEEDDENNKKEMMSPNSESDHMGIIRL